MAGRGASAVGGAGNDRCLLYVLVLLALSPWRAALLGPREKHAPPLRNRRQITTRR